MPLHKFRKKKPMLHFGLSFTLRRKGRRVTESGNRKPANWVWLILTTALMTLHQRVSSVLFRDPVRLKANEPSSTLRTYSYRYECPSYKRSLSEWGWIPRCIYLMHSVVQWAPRTTDVFTSFTAVWGILKYSQSRWDELLCKILNPAALRLVSEWMCEYLSVEIPWGALC